MCAFQNLEKKCAWLIHEVETCLLLLLLLCDLYTGYLWLYAWKPHVSRVYSVAAILWLKFMLHVTLFLMINVLYLYISTLWSTCTVPRMAVFSSFLVFCFPDIFWMILRWFQLPLILIVSLLFLHSTCAVFWMWGLQNMLTSFLNHTAVSWHCSIY